MQEVWIIVAGIIISAVMGGLKTPLVWLKRQRDIVKALIVLALAAGLFFLLKSFGLAEGSGAEIPVAALVAMGVRAFADSFKNIWQETPDEKATRVSQ